MDISAQGPLSQGNGFIMPQIKQEPVDVYNFDESSASCPQISMVKQEPIDLGYGPFAMNSDHLQAPPSPARKKPTKKKVKKEPKQESITEHLPVKKKRDRFNGMSEEEVLQRLLPDHLAPNLDIVIVGINPGLTAAYVGHHYAGPGNHFWKCLFLSSLIPEPMNAFDDFKLLKYGIGFTNIVARTTRGSADLTRKEIKEGSEILMEKIKQYKPKIAVFNGKGIYEVFVGHKNFHIGKQPEPFPGSSDTAVFVMPSSSARFTQLPRAVDKVPFYVALKKLRDHLRGELNELPETEICFPDLDLKVKVKEEPKDGSQTVEEKPPPKRKRERKRKSKDSVGNTSADTLKGLLDMGSPPGQPEYFPPGWSFDPNFRANQAMAMKQEQCMPNGPGGMFIKQEPGLNNGLGMYIKPEPGTQNGVICGSLQNMSAQYNHNGATGQNPYWNNMQSPQGMSHIKQENMSDYHLYGGMQSQNMPSQGNSPQAAGFHTQQGQNWPSNYQQMAGQQFGYWNQTSTPVRPSMHQHNQTTPPQMGMNHTQSQGTPPQIGMNHSHSPVNPSQMNMNPTPSQMGMNHAQSPNTPSQMGMNHAQSPNTSSQMGMNHGQNQGTPPQMGMNHGQNHGTPPQMGMNHVQNQGTPPQMSMNHVQSRGTPPQMGMSHAQGSTTPSQMNMSHAQNQSTPSQLGMNHAQSHSSPPQMGMAQSPATPSQLGMSHAQGLPTPPHMSMALTQSQNTPPQMGMNLSHPGHLSPGNQSSPHTRTSPHTHSHNSALNHSQASPHNLSQASPLSLSQTSPLNLSQASPLSLSQASPINSSHASSLEGSSLHRLAQMVPPSTSFSEVTPQDSSSPLHHLTPLNSPVSQTSPLSHPPNLPHNYQYRP